jgi:hypothetical protein
MRKNSKNNNTANWKKNNIKNCSFYGLIFSINQTIWMDAKSAHLVA